MLAEVAPYIPQWREFARMFQAYLGQEETMGLITNIGCLVAGAATLYSADRFYFQNDAPSALEQQATATSEYIRQAKQMTDSIRLTYCPDQPTLSLDSCVSYGIMNAGALK